MSATNVERSKSTRNIIITQHTQRKRTRGSNGIVIVRNSRRRRIQYRTTDYKSYIIDPKKEVNKNKSISISDYKTMNNLNVYLLSELHSKYSHQVDTRTQSIFFLRIRLIKSQ